MGNRENECQFSQNYIFYMDFSEIYLGFHNSCEIWHSFSRTPMRNFLWCYFRWLITSLVLQKCKTENAIFFKLFWCKVFVPLELKLLHFLVDSAVNVLWSDIKLNCSLKKRPTFYLYLLRIPTFEIWTDILLLFVCLFFFSLIDFSQNLSRSQLARLQTMTFSRAYTVVYRSSRAWVSLAVTLQRKIRDCSQSISLIFLVAIVIFRYCFSCYFRIVLFSSCYFNVCRALFRSTFTLDLGLLLFVIFLLFCFLSLFAC